MNSANATPAVPHVVPVRISGVTYRVTLSSAPNGRCSWSTKTRHGMAMGNAPTPLAALQSAREFLQCVPWSHQEVESTDEELDALLEQSTTLARGGVRKFGKAAGR